MPPELADLHIHSRFSRATSKSVNLENLHRWGAFKGLRLVGTGDMTHPVWLEELSAKLRMLESGLYAMDGLKGGPLFVPTGEVSCIFKKDGRGRRVHLVVIAPDLEAAGRFSRALGRVGKIESDGRPVLGLPARDVLEMALLADPRMQVIPAHIWTPWYSLFGSKSGFDRLEDCFGDLSSHITALETGLSSDPAMNRLVSALDGYALVSSSDAHGCEKLGREATVIEGPLSFEALSRALHGGPELIGTVEFFPEEGKYHLDGHSGCGPGLAPAQTREVGGICPVCGKPLTVGVLSRVYELADRDAPPAEIMRPDWHVIPLAELLGQVFDTGPGSKAVLTAYQRLIEEFGAELSILLETPVELIREKAGALLARAVQKMRAGEVEVAGGYDGVYGQVKVLSDSERSSLAGDSLLLGAAPPKRGGRSKAKAGPKALNSPAEASASTPATKP